MSDEATIDDPAEYLREHYPNATRIEKVLGMWHLVFPGGAELSIREPHKSLGGGEFDWTITHSPPGASEVREVGGEYDDPDNPPRQFGSLASCVEYVEAEGGIELFDPERYLRERYGGLNVEPKAHTDEGVPRVYEAETGADDETDRFRLTFLHQTPMDNDPEGWVVTYCLPGGGKGRVGATPVQLFDDLPTACEVAEEIVGDRLRERIKDHQDAVLALTGEAP